MGRLRPARREVKREGRGLVEGAGLGLAEGRALDWWKGRGSGCRMGARRAGAGKLPAQERAELPVPTRSVPVCLPGTITLPRPRCPGQCRRAERVGEAVGSA